MAGMSEELNYSLYLILIATCGWWLLIEQHNSRVFDDKEISWRTTSGPVPRIDKKVPNLPKFCIVIPSLLFKSEEFGGMSPFPIPNTLFFTPVSPYFSFSLHSKASQEEPRDFSAGNKIEQIGNLLRRSSKQTYPRSIKGQVECEKQHFYCLLP